MTSPFQAGFDSPRGQERPRLYAAAKMETAKTTKYKPLMESSHPKRSLHLAILESTGAFGLGLQALLKLCSQFADAAKFSQSAEHRSWSSSSFSSYWSQRISLGFWRGAFSHSLSFLARGGERPTYELATYCRAPQPWLGAHTGAAETHSSQQSDQSPIIARKAQSHQSPTIARKAQQPKSPAPMRSPLTDSRSAILAADPVGQRLGPGKGPTATPAAGSSETQQAGPVAASLAVGAAPPPIPTTGPCRPSGRGGVVERAQTHGPGPSPRTEATPSTPLRDSASLSGLAAGPGRVPPPAACGEMTPPPGLTVARAGALARASQPG